MTNRLSKLVLAAVLLSSIPAAASAGGWEHDRDGAPPPGWDAPAAPPGYPAPPYAGAYPAYPERPRPEPRQWREHRWRERELAEVTAQLRALDAQRDRFYVENRFRPGRLSWFDRRYAARRAALEQRWNELQTVAWR